MIARPLSLPYQPFDVVAVDYDRILSSYASDAGLMPLLDIDVDALVVLGSTSPVVREDLRRAASRTQRHTITSGRYAHNVAYRQVLGLEARSRLECPVPAPKPLCELSLHEGDLVVLDSGVTLRKSDTDVSIEACDYPPFLARPSDGRVTLRLAQREADRLLSDPAWVDGWNPFVRILARRSGLTAGGPSLDVLTLSTKRPDLGAASSGS